jgi:Glycosyltransferase like family 2
MGQAGLTRAPEGLAAGLARLRGNPSAPPSASIAVPVNARGDVDNVLVLLGDLSRYRGPHTFEVILGVNNFPPAEPPTAIERLRALGIRVEAVPTLDRRPGEAVCLAARMIGVRAAVSPFVILFDADCRIPDPEALLDWYVGAFRDGAALAYSRVDYVGLRPRASIRARIIAHNLARWTKRVVFRIPTTRGSNYGLERDLMIRLHDEGVLADDLNVGPAVKWASGRIVYSNAASHRVLTSGRMFRGGWMKLLRYLVYRLRYNVRVLPVRPDAASRTGRERDRPDRYHYDQPS